MEGYSSERNAAPRNSRRHQVREAIRAALLSVPLFFVPAEDSEAARSHSQVDAVEKTYTAPASPESILTHDVDRVLASYDERTRGETEDVIEEERKELRERFENALAAWNTGIQIAQLETQKLLAQEGVQDPSLTPQQRREKIQELLTRHDEKLNAQARIAEQEIADTLRDVSEQIATIEDKHQLESGVHPRDALGVGRVEEVIDKIEEIFGSNHSSDVSIPLQMQPGKYSFSAVIETIIRVLLEQMKDAPASSSSSAVSDKERLS